MGGQNRTSGPNRRNRRQGRRTTPRKGSRTSTVLWTLGIVAVVGAGFVATRNGGAAHPEPRAGVGPEHVVPAARYTSYPRVARVYRQAAEVPHVLDGLYCYCRCSEHSGHYSLLDCFNDNHAARCDVCMSEAAMAHEMNRDGKSLDQIRAAIDNLYGS